MVSEHGARITGRRLGEFVVGERIGRGGFGDVYRARQASLERDAVIKVLRPSNERSPRHVQMFEREARLASQLDHPYAAHVYAFGAEPDGLLWIAMELVRGTSLAEWLETHGPMQVGRFVPLFERICEVVHTAHAAGLIHRDIKPANIMVITRAGRLMPKLLDFGIATLLEASLPAPPGEGFDDEDTAVHLVGDATERTHTIEDGRGSGTPAYMAPERWQPGSHDHRVDVYALGVVAYRCLAGKLPFQGTTPRELYLAHARQPVPPLGASWPPALDAVLAKALAKQPAARYGSALELAGAVAGAIAAEPSGWLSRGDARRWLIDAPPHLAACVAAVAAAPSLPEAQDAAQRLVAALAQWIGVVALAAAVGLGTDVGELGKLRRGTLAPREWLELARALCAPYSDREELFPIPELVHWFVDEGAGGPEALLALLALTRTDEPSFPSDVLGHVLRGMGFVHGYTLLIGGAEWTAATHGRVRHDGAIWISDGDGNPLFALSPLVIAAPPAPGEAFELFALAGGGRGGARLVAYPEGFEHESPAVWAYLAEHVSARASERSPTSDDRPPFRGLAAFSRDDAELFFGRDRQVESLLNRVLVQPFVALTGPSGSGKSSLVHAGLVPRLPAEWLVIAMRPGRSPRAALEAALADAGIAGLAATQAWLRDSRRRLLLVVDQAEELLTISDPAERGKLAAAIVELASLPGDRVRVVITLRHDFIGRADELPEWRELIGHNLVLLTVPSRAELAEMIAGPAEHAGYGFDDPALVTDMVEEVADRPGALPLLSFAAARLWEARDPGAQLLTRASYTAMGGVGGALARYAEETLSALSPRQQAVARELFRHLITSEGTRVPARRADLVTIAQGADLVLEHLIGSRILVASEGVAGDEEIAIAHEALVDRWPRLVQWRADDAAGAHHRDELRTAAALWHQRGRDASYLWRGQAVATYQRWAARWAGGLTATETAFAETSVRAMTRARRFRRIGIGAALALLSAAVLVLASLNRRASASQAEAEQRQTDLLAETGRSELLADRPLRALLYLAAAYQRGADGPGIRVALGQAARAMDREQSHLQMHHGPAAIASAGSLYVSAAVGERLRAWRLDGGRFVLGVTFDYVLDESDSFAISPSGNIVAVASFRDRHVKIWDRDGKLLGDGTDGLEVDQIAIAGDDLIATSWGNVIALWDRHAHQLGLLGTFDAGAERRVGRLALDADRRTLAAVFNDGTLELWSLGDRRLIARVPLGERPIGVSFAGDRVLIGTHGGSVIAVTATDGTVAYRTHAHLGGAVVAVSPDGTTFVTGGRERQARVWSVADGHQIGVLEHPYPVQSVAYSPDGKTIAASGPAGMVGLWDAQRYTTLGNIDLGAELHSVAFTADGSQILLGDANGLIRRYGVASDNQLTTFSAHGAQVQGVAFSPDGASVATIGSDDHLRVWRAATGESLATFFVDGSVNARLHPAFSEDGRLIAAGHHHDGGVWDVGRGVLVNQLSTDDVIPYAVSFDRRGRVAVTSMRNGGASSRVRVWDLSTEQIVASHSLDQDAYDVSFGPDGLLAIVTGRKVMVWDVDHDRVLWSADSVRSFDVDFSRDGRFVTASGDTGFVRVFDARTGAVHRDINQPASNTEAVALSPDGSLLAAASGDDRIYVWDVEAGKLAAVLSGHRNPVSGVAFSPDGTRLASSGYDGNAFVWALGRETRSPGELARAIAERVPFELKGGELVSRKR